MTPILLLCLITAAPNGESGQFSNVQIEEPFHRYIMGDVLLMESVNPVKEVELADGRRIVIAVGSVVRDGDSPRGRLDAERIAYVKAHAALVARYNPTSLSQTEDLRERAAITVNNGREQGEATTEIRRTIRTRVEGTVRDLPVIGRWTSRDGSTLYVAVGAIGDRSAELAPDSPYKVARHAGRGRPSAR